MLLAPSVNGWSEIMNRMSRLALFAALVSAGTLSVAADQKDTAKGGGQVAFNNHCRTCHSVQPGDNRLGPNLHAILGRKAGEEKGYAAYSQAMKSADLTWDAATLEKFIADPETVVRNNNMKPYKGIPDAGVRKEIVAYLKSIG
jgi:cytochrome c